MSIVAVIAFFFFFFQAEDGIRDYKVTGVQTCALPILISSWTAEQALPAPRRGHGAAVVGGVLYVFGGEAGNGFLVQSTVFAAPIAGSGALGAWTTAPALPTADYVFGKAVAGSRIYLTGGYPPHPPRLRAAAGAARFAPPP